MCKKEKCALAKENERLNNPDAQKEIEIVNLKKRVKILLQDLSSITSGHDNLLKLLGNNKAIYDKYGLGFENDQQSDTTTTENYFVSSNPMSSKLAKHQDETNALKVADESNTSFKRKTNSSGPKQT